MSELVLIGICVGIGVAHLIRYVLDTTSKVELGGKSGTKVYACKRCMVAAMKDKKDDDDEFPLTVCTDIKERYCCTCGRKYNHKLYQRNGYLKDVSFERED